VHGEQLIPFNHSTSLTSSPLLSDFPVFKIQIFREGQKDLKKNLPLTSKIT
jgi:hypothetical protein